MPKLVDAGKRGEVGFVLLTKHLPTSSIADDLGMFV